MEWYFILLICLVSLFVWTILNVLLYKLFFKRFYDIIISGIAIIALSPLYIILIIIGSIAMKGNPFFKQKRPGKNEKVFSLIKFRTMTCEKDENGVLLPDEKRLSKYGKILRSTSLDELPELFNIFIGNMSIIGPRPLLVKYLPLYNDFQKHRHDVRPGLTGFAQCHGRNSLSWEEKFEMDVYYTKNISFFGDLVIFFKTIGCVFKRSGINSSTSMTMDEFKGSKNL